MKKFITFLFIILSFSFFGCAFILDKITTDIQDFYDEENAIIFGCAGLKQTLCSGISTDGLGLFMFGEVCTLNGHSDFGNLMLSKIIFNKK